MSEKFDYTPPQIEKKGKTYIPEVLSSHYKAEKIHTCHVETVDEHTIRSTFVFPEYDRTVESLGHVSMAQMHEGLMEGLYACVQHTFETGALNTDIDRSNFVQNAMHSIYKYESIEFVEMLQSEEAATLSICLKSVEESNSARFKKATFEVDGFMKGTVVCLLPNM